MSPFGELLCKHRLACTDRAFSKTRLSQERLGELIGKELGISGGYSGAAISDWEHGKSKIHADERAVLASLIKVLFKNEGLKTIAEADRLLEAGDYRALSQAEKEQIFPKELLSAQAPEPEKRQGLAGYVAERVFYGNRDLMLALAKAEEGPSPAWPRKIVATTKLMTRNWSAGDALRLVVWGWVCVFVFLWVYPSVTWPFVDRQQAAEAMSWYVVAALAIPVSITWLADARQDPFWRERPAAAGWKIRLYTYLGASTGFCLGYVSIFLIHLTGYFAGIQLGACCSPLLRMLVEPAVGLLKAVDLVLLLGFSYGCARLAPYNLWKAYERLELADGGAFFIFLLAGPLIGAGFYAAYPFILDPTWGWLVIAVAATLAIWIEERQQRQRGSTWVPAYTWALGLGSVCVLSLISAGADLLGIVLFAGLILAFSIFLKLGRLRVTLRGLAVFVIALYFLGIVAQKNAWLGGAAACAALLAWWRWGRKYLSFPRRFWGVILAAAGCAWLVREARLPELQACLVYAAVVLALLGWEIRDAGKPAKLI